MTGQTAFKTFTLFLCSCDAQSDPCAVLLICCLRCGLDSGAAPEAGRTAAKHLGPVDCSRHRATVLNGRSRQRKLGGLCSIGCFCGAYLVCQKMLQPEKRLAKLGVRAQGLKSDKNVIASQDVA